MTGLDQHPPIKVTISGLNGRPPNDRPICRTRPYLFMSQPGRKQISRAMIAGTLSPSHEEEQSELEPSKVPSESKEHGITERSVNESNNNTNKSDKNGMRDVLRDPESSAILSLSSIHPRYPLYEYASPEPGQLSTIPEMPDTPAWVRTPERHEPTRPTDQRQGSSPKGALELRSPTSVYSQPAEDPFVSHEYSPQLLQSDSMPAHGMTRLFDGVANKPKSPFVTVLNDPRAQDLSFMQSTRNGWTADLDQFVYSRHELGPNSPRTFIPEYGTILDYAKAARKQKQPTNQRSSVECELAAVGYDRVHAAIEKQEQGGKFEFEKSLPSPPLESFSPEIRARLGISSASGQRRVHQRSETAPSPMASDAKSRPEVPAPLRITPPSKTWLPHAQSLSDLRGRDTVLRSPSRSPERSPSRLARLRSRLGQSPERQARSEDRSRSPEHLYLRPSRINDNDSPERRGRALTREVSPELQASRRENHEHTHPRLHGRDRNRGDIVDQHARGPPERSTTLPVFPIERMPRASVDKLWGERGVLSRPNESPSQSDLLKGKKTPLKQLASKLFKSKDPVPYPKFGSPESPETKPVQVGLHSKFPISIERGDQMRLFGEIEYMLQTLANDFLLEQLELGRLSKKSIKEAVDRWSRRGRAQVVDFCFDLRTQLELLQQNLEAVQFHGRDAFDGKRRFVLVYAWKDVARELAVRSFCSADSAVRKMLSDCYVILDMLGAEGAYWLIFQKLHVTTLDKIRVAEVDRRKKEEQVKGQTRQVIPGSPAKTEEDEEQIHTTRHLFESV